MAEPTQDEWLAKVATLEAELAAARRDLTATSEILRRRR
jgi:hypothetical protein